MNKINIILLLLLGIFFFSGCSDETDRGVIPKPGDNSAVLSIHLGSSRTRAFDTPDEEKEVKSVACFIQTNDTGEVGTPTYKQGSFMKYFFDTLNDNGDGTYTINLEIKTNSLAGETQVVMIANYKENGLYDVLNGISSLEKLADVRTQSVTASGITTPLLMYAEEKVALQFGTQTTKIFTLRRVMTRIDVYNEIPDTAEKPFELESAAIVNPKQYSYIIPGNEDAFNIPVLKEGFNPGTPGSDPTRIEGLYTYETANDGSSNHTSILVKGTLGGIPYSKIIKLLKGDEPVPLGRNTRYQITLNSSPDPTEITFSFKIEDWLEGVDIPAPPTNETPDPANFTFDGGFTQARWSAPEKLYNMEGQQSGSIAFSVTGLQETITEVASVFHVPGSEFDVSDIVKGGSVIYNPNGTITQNFTIEFSTAGQLSQREPVDIYVILKNAVKPSYRDTIWITNILNYPETEFKPVWFSGLYWAPVNVGQTILGSELQKRETIGYVYQWGRNKEYDSFVGLTDTEILKGPVKLAEANSPANINKFITSATADWLLASEDPVTRNNLWIEGKDGNTPCPAGWRIPTKAEYQLLVDQYNDNKMIDEQYYRFVFIGDDRQNLYFPYAGFINYTNGQTSPPSQRTLVWTVTLAEPPKKAVSTFDILPNLSMEFNDFGTGYGFGLRCVRK